MESKILSHYVVAGVLSIVVPFVGAAEQEVADQD